MGIGHRRTKDRKHGKDRDEHKSRSLKKVKSAEPKQFDKEESILIESGLNLKSLNETDSMILGKSPRDQDETINNKK
jgi:hypothetical protein